MSADHSLTEDENRTCTLAILGGFGGKYSLGEYGDTFPNGVDNEVSLEDFKARCRHQVIKLNKYADYPLKDLAIVMATTSSLQVYGEKNLKALGFVQSGPFASKKYNGVSNVSVWLMPAADFVEAIKE